MFGTPRAVADLVTLDCPVLGCLRMEGQPLLRVLEAVDNIDRNKHVTVTAHPVPGTNHERHLLMFES